MLHIVDSKSLASARREKQKYVVSVEILRFQSDFKEKSDKNEVKKI